MMNYRIHIWVITSALTIFLLGFENLVTSCSEQISQKLWGLISGIQGLAMASTLYGTAVGALLALTSWASFTQNHAIVPTCIFAIIAALELVQSAFIWLFISEIFPNSYRVAGQEPNSFTHGIFSALLTRFYPTMVIAFSHGNPFAFFRLHDAASNRLSRSHGG